jgi:hypothetical protein
MQVYDISVKLIQEHFIITVGSPHAVVLKPTKNAFSVRGGDHQFHLCREWAMRTPLEFHMEFYIIVYGKYQKCMQFLENSREIPVKFLSNSL